MDYASLRPTSSIKIITLNIVEFRRRIFSLLNKEYDDFSFGAMENYSFLSPSEQHKLDMTIASMLVSVFFRVDR